MNNILTIAVGILLIDIAILFHNRDKFTTDSFLCVEEEVTDTVEVEEPPLFLDTMYND